MFGSVTVWHGVLKLFCLAYICIYNKFYLIYFISIQYPEYLEVLPSTRRPMSTWEPVSFWLAAPSHLVAETHTDPSMAFQNWNTCGYGSRSPTSALVLTLNLFSLGSTFLHIMPYKAIRLEATLSGSKTRYNTVSKLYAMIRHNGGYHGL